ncbi:MAG: DUF3267 domain-containing protein [Eubacteriales bacterium]
MKEGKTFVTDLPDGYTAAATVDAKDKKTIIVMNAAALAVMVLTAGIAWAVIRPSEPLYEYIGFVRYMVFLAAILLYIVLHELAHGAAYRLLTGRKLTFGLTLSVAYCGVPDIYVYRKTALISLLAPFTVFIPVFLLPAVLLPGEWDRFFASVLLAIHLSGCVGDLYDTLLYAVKFRDPLTLMRDTGPKQTFYIPQR